MTDLSPPRPDHLTVHDLLFGDLSASDGAKALASAVTAVDGARTALAGIQKLHSAARGAVDHEVGIAADSLLDFELGDAVVAGWLTYGELLRAGRRTLGSSAREVVELVSHRITATYSPHVDLYVDDLHAGTVEFRLDLVFDIVGCAAVIASGDLVAIQGGDVKVTGTLAVEGSTLITRSQQLPTYLVVPLQHPVPLARSAI